MRISKFFFFLVVLILIMKTTSLAQKAVITETEATFKTYPFSDPDPVAVSSKIYPYFRFDGYSITGTVHKWKMVTLENPYIKVFVMPEIGGKIWGAMEKSGGKMFIYYNDVVKFRNIAMRGPWTSGGIEGNFGIIGHTPTGSTPVDYMVQENSDSSVSCFIGALDLITGAVWQMEIRLPADKAYFETKVLWHNKTPLNRPYYHWMNGAAPARNDLTLFFPGRAYIGHSGDAHSWPYDKSGRNLSRYNENNFGSYKSYHVLGEYAAFFGGYYYGDHYGFGHLSDYGDKPGKKIWIWGLSRQGMIWENLLTDQAGQYIEIQSGSLFNQAADASTLTPFKHCSFSPYATAVWSEKWFPVKGTEGMKAVSSYGILNVEHKDGKLKIYFNPLQKLNDTLCVAVDGKNIYKRYIELTPMEIYSDSTAENLGDNFTVSLGNKIKYSYGDEKKNYLNRPLSSVKNFDWNSVQGLAVKAKEAARQLNLEKALNFYKRCIEKDANYLDALTGIAELYYRRMEYDTALVFAKRALAVDTYDGFANFIYGLINKKMDFTADAKDGFAIAAHSMEYRSAAFTELAGIYVHEGAWEKAAEFANHALDYNRYNISAIQVLIVSLRKSGKSIEAKKKCDDLLAIMPLNHFARFEKYLLDKNKDLLKNFNSLIRNELPHETYLDIAVTYFNLGLLKEALTVLKYAPVNPIIYYWESYLALALGDNIHSLKLLKKAEEISPYLVFPFRTETAEVLSRSASLSDTWKNKYYLALVYLRHGRLDKTKKLLNACNDRPDYAPFYLTRAKLNRGADIQSAIKDVQKSIKLDNGNRRAVLLLSAFFNDREEYQNALKTLEKLYRKNKSDYRIAVPYAKALYQVEKYEACLGVLDKTEVLPFEGAAFGRELYRNAHLMAAMRLAEQKKYSFALKHIRQARMWPEHLGAGKPYEPNELLEDYIEMFISEKEGDRDKAALLLKKIEKYLRDRGYMHGADNVIKALVLKRKGNAAAAIKVLDKWRCDSPDNLLAKWVSMKFIGNIETNQSTNFKQLKANQSYRLYYNLVKLSE